MSVTKNVTRGKVTVDLIRSSKHQKKGTLTAQLRQTIKIVTTYPATKVSNGVGDDLFGIQEFTNIGQGKTYENTENRVTFVIIPNLINGVAPTKEMIQAKIDALYTQGKTPCIQKVIANKPILNENQEAAIKSGQAGMDVFANSQVVRYGTQHAKAGQLVLDSENRAMYKQTYFFENLVEDVNNCDGDIYMSPQIAEELGSMNATSLLEESNNVLDF